MLVEKKLAMSVYGVELKEEKERGALGVNAVGAIQVSLQTCSSTYEPVQVKETA